MYGLAIGLSLIFGTMRIIFLSQGAVIILMAYFCYWLFTLFKIDPYLSIPIIGLAAVALGAGLYQGLFRRAVKMEDKNITLLIAVGLMFLCENLMAVNVDSKPKIHINWIHFFVNSCGWSRYFVYRLIGFVMAMLSTAGVTIFLKRTLVGKAVRAASEDIEAARLVGISPHWVLTIALLLESNLCGIAGIALSATYPFDPYFGFIFSLKAMIALALRAWEACSGALLGGIILGTLESWSLFLYQRWMGRCGGAEHFFWCYCSSPRSFGPVSEKGLEDEKY